MNCVKRVLITLVATSPIVVGAFVGTAGTASAYSGIDMNLACQYTAGRTSYAAKVVNQNASGWRCYDRAGWGPTIGANLWGFCVDVMGENKAYNTNGNVYGWHCA